MPLPNRSVLLSAAFALLFIGCDATEIDESDIDAIVARDATAFAKESIPIPVLDRIAENKLVIIGERHFLREHHEFVVQMLRDLHDRGFRQLLLEWPHMANWLMDDYVKETGLAPRWTPPADLYFDLLTGVRDFNRSLPADEKVDVIGIDINLDDYGGATSFRSILSAFGSTLPGPGPLADFASAAYGTTESQLAATTGLKAALESNRSSLAGSWGIQRFEQVLEMVDVELASITIRDRYRSNYDRAAGNRESIMKRLADSYLRNYAHSSLLNVGLNHAQKSRLRGTDHQWLGEYLVSSSTAVGGSTLVVAVSVARVIVGNGSPSNELDASPTNELWRCMNNRWPDSIVFLPLDDPVFSNEATPVNFEDEIYVAAPKRHFDALLLYPIAHRVN